jgi:hypothetical protein
MKNFKQLIKELPCSKIVVAYGDFQPPTSVHEHLVKAVKTVAGSSADYAIYASANEDKKYNPLPVDRKVYFLNRMFPGTNFQETTEQTIVDLAKKLNEKYKVLTVVVGEDKVAAVEKQLNKANGKEYTFESIKVVSTGSTDPDSDLSSGVSGLRMCESAKAGKFGDFKKGLPHTLTEHDSRRLMNEVRKGLGQEPIKEVVEFQRSSIREQYIAGKIFNVGDKVQDDKGTYEIMDRGANYITVVNESGELSKKWIDKVTAIETIAEDIPGGYAPEEITFKGYSTKNLHHSKDAAMAFQQTIHKYQGGLITDGVAILNALKATDTYMKLGDLHIEQMKPPVASEVKEWVTAHMKAKESLERIGEFLHHMDYWDSHGHELQMLMTNYKETGKGEVSESHNTGETMANDKLRNDPETKRVMLRYKDFIKNATMTEPPVEMGQESAVDYKKPEEPKTAGKQTESDIDSEVKKTEPKHVATGFAMQKPFDVNDTLRRQKVKYQLGEGRGLADKYYALAQDRKATADENKDNHETYHTHMADHHDHMSRYHEELGQHSQAQAHADKADIHHDKSMKKQKSKNTVKEDVYASDYTVHQHIDPVTGKTKSHKIHPNRINFAASGAQGGLVKDKKPKMSALDKWRAGAAVRQKQQAADDEYYQQQKSKPYSAKADQERSQSMSRSIEKLHKTLTKEELEVIDEISKTLAGNYYGSATKQHLDKVGMKSDMYNRIEKDMGKNRKAGVDRALDRVTGARKTNEELDTQAESWVLKQSSMIGKEKAAPKEEAPAVAEAPAKKSGWPYLGESVTGTIMGAIAGGVATKSIKGATIGAKVGDTLTNLKKKSKKVVKDNQTFDPANAGGSPPFDPFFEEAELDEMVAEYADLEDMLEEYEDSELVLVDEETDEIVEDDSFDQIDEVLSRTQRLKAKVRFNRSSTKRGRLLKIRLKTKSTPERINQRAKRLAMRTLKAKIAKKSIGSMNVSDKERVERVLHNPQMQSVIKRLAMKMANHVREVEAKRIHKKAAAASPNAKHHIKKK